MIFETTKNKQTKQEMLSTFLFLFTASIRKSPSFKERLVRALSPKSLRRKANEEGGGGGGGDATFYDSDVYITPIPLEGKGRDSRTEGRA